MHFKLCAFWGVFPVVIVDKICVFPGDSRGETCNKLEMWNNIKLFGHQISTFEFARTSGAQETGACGAWAWAWASLGPRAMRCLGSGGAPMMIFIIIDRQQGLLKAVLKKIIKAFLIRGKAQMKQALFHKRWRTALWSVVVSQLHSGCLGDSHAGQALWRNLTIT